MNKSRGAFTLLEIMVVISIMAFMAAILVPRLLMKSPQAEWPAILADLNDIVFFARQEAISGQKICRLVFKANDTQPDSVIVEEELDNPEKRGSKIYRQISSFYFNTHYIFHPTVKLKALYYGKHEYLSNNKGVGYCYVIPDGLVQDILIHIARKDQDKGIDIPASFTLAPFYGKFDIHDGFMRPGR